jgi:hypothetical protein
VSFSSVFWSRLFTVFAMSAALSAAAFVASAEPVWGADGAAPDWDVDAGGAAVAGVDVAAGSG